MAEIRPALQCGPEMIDVLVCYATTVDIVMLEVNLKRDSTIREAIACSQIMDRCPEIEIDRCKVGIFGKLKLLESVLQQGDRVEIYRPLTADPMEARRRRALKREKT